MESASLQKWSFFPFFDLLTDEKSLCKRLFIDSANSEIIDAKRVTVFLKRILSID